MNYKTKNVLYSIITLLVVTFILMYAAFIGDNLLKTNTKIIFWYLGFFGFYFILGNIYYLNEIREQHNQYNPRSSVAILFIVMLSSLLPMFLALSVYTFNLGKQILWLNILEFSLLYIFFIIFNTFFSKLTISFGLNKDFQREFINKHAWFLIFHNLNYRLEEGLIILYDKKNKFILKLYENINNDFKIQFKDQREITIKPKEEETDSNQKVIDLLTDIKDEPIKGQEPLTKIEEIEPNNNAKELLSSYQAHIEKGKFNYVIAIFYQFSDVKVKGEVPEWFYWNDKEKFKQYITKLKNVNKKINVESDEVAV